MFESLITPCSPSRISIASMCCIPVIVLRCQPSSRSKGGGTDAKEVGGICTPQEVKGYIRNLAYSASSFASQTVQGWILTLWIFPRIVFKRICHPGNNSPQLDYSYSGKSGCYATDLNAHHHQREVGMLVLQSLVWPLLGSLLGL